MIQIDNFLGDLSDISAKNTSPLQTRVTEADIIRYAEERGLPVGYASPFFQAMRKLNGPLAAMTSSVPYEVFSRYVGAREIALKRSFDKLDKGALQMRNAVIYT